METIRKIGARAVHAVNLVRHAARDLATGGKRSAHWPAVEHAFRCRQPVCQACGSDKRPQVHHKRPFHLHPELELDPNNLITLCMGPNECHLQLGHLGNFKAYDPDIAAHAAEVWAHPERRAAIIAQAMKNRRFA